MSWRRVLLLVPLAACLALLPTAAARPAQHKMRTPAISLRLNYRQDNFLLKYRLNCDPVSGTLPRAKAACAAIHREPDMVLGTPEAPGVGNIPCPHPHWFLTITGTYRGRRAQTTFPRACGEASNAGELWLNYLPSFVHLQTLRVDRGLGPLRLGESAAFVSSLLGPPTERKGGLQVYNLHVVLQVHVGVPVIFAVGYGRSGHVNTLIYNGLPFIYGERQALPPLPGSRVARWPTIICGGRPARADHHPAAGRAMTIIWPSVDHPTDIVTRAAAAACAGALATEPAAVAQA